MAGAGMSDGELLLRARDGDSTAWEALVDRLGARVWAITRAHYLRKVDADDVCQVTWMRLLTHIDRIREPERVGAWLASTARHECLRVLRCGAREVPTGDDELPAGELVVSPPDTRLLAAERQDALWEALATLPPHCQRLLRLFMVDTPPTYEEVTAALDIPPGSIGPTRRRCLEKLRQHLAGINGEGRSTRKAGGTR